MPRRQQKPRPKFTPIELMVMVAVGAILLSILAPNLRRARERPAPRSRSAVVEHSGQANTISGESRGTSSPLVSFTQGAAVVAAIVLGVGFIVRSRRRQLRVVEQPPPGMEE
jgi:hypothetical protein